MYGMMDFQESKRRQEELLREAEQPPEEGSTSKSEGIRYSPVGIDCGVGAD